ncbi:MAG: phosphohistidine phosphatase SixA [Saprospiraceae bacterium]|jgi:phosphohistidine phosphatase SixA
MRISIYLLLLAIALIPVNSCATYKNQTKETTIFLVRHAEKADDSKDPELSPIGSLRALSLAARLKSKKLDKVYSSDYKRTRNTAKPSADQIKKIVDIYDPRNHTELINQLKNRSGQTFLIVGHSNSTPSLVNQILGREAYTTLDHEEYNKLFVLKCDKDWKCTDSVETYE